MGTGRAIRNTLERQARNAPPKTFRLNVMPFNNAVGAVVTNMGPQNVDTVLNAGKVMKRGGQMVGLDFARLQRLGDEARDRVYTAAKVKNSRV